MTTAEAFPNWITDNQYAFTTLYNTKQQEKNIIQDKIYCCLKFKWFINDIEVKGDTVTIDKHGKVTFVTTGYSDEEETLTKYPVYDFKFCPFCGNSI